MTIPRYPVFIALAVLLTVCANALAQRTTDPLEPIMRCIQTGKFQVLEQQRLPATVTSRSVSTLSGTKAVTMADGYRLILATSQGLPFINIKVEMSVPSAAAADRAAVQEQMQAFSSRRAAGQRELESTMVAGTEVLALHQPDLDRPGPISFYSMFVPAKSLVATIYVLNQQPERRAFSSYSEYEALRDEAATLVRTCVGSGGA